ncbi:MAG: uridine kinase [Cyclobacteriaceae bacterium]
MTLPYTIGITGGSGSGKTFFIKNLESRFTRNELCLISQDHYYHPRETQREDERGIKNFDLPESIDSKQFLQDILFLKQGNVLKKQEYTFNNPGATPKTLEFKPAPIIIIEGLFVQYFPEIEKELDLKIFIEAKDYLKLSRRIRRDNEERGYDLDDVLYRYQHHVMPIYETLIGPLKHRADIVIPNNSHFERALDLLTLAIRAKLAGFSAAGT